MQIMLILLNTGGEIIQWDLSFMRVCQADYLSRKSQCAAWVPKMRKKNQALNKSRMLLGYLLDETWRQLCKLGPSDF